MRISGRWLYERETSLARRVALSPLVPLSWLYGAGARIHRAVYRRGLRAPSKLSCRVVAVGGLSVGGSGKTPTAAWIATELHSRGHKVVIASRGYGRRGRQPVVTVSDGHSLLASGAEAGDEPLLLAAHARGVPVLVGRDRSVVGLRAVSAFGAAVLVLDDGFQHHRLARDVDVVLVDCELGFGNRQLLPRGPLREPVSALAYADAVGVIGESLAPADEKILAREAAKAFRFRAQRVPVHVRSFRGGETRDVATLAGLEVGILAGIARPGSLSKSVEDLGGRVVARRSFPDHHRYRLADLEGLEREARIWITTEKDAVKLSPAWVSEVDLRILTIRLQVDDSRRVGDWLESRLM